ncbi:MAG: hypothetical protein WC917_04585 [Bacilli bacterium]
MCRKEINNPADNGILNECFIGYAENIYAKLINKGYDREEIEIILNIASIELTPAGF